jgi:prepilin-type N-terminal cleavage/methylation domain-containing protein
MKKGFTIVELAIVLVVIGIILGMAVKGRQLVDSARVKADLAKIQKIEAAVNIWFAKTGEVPLYSPMDPGHTKLIDMGVALHSDFVLDTLHMPHPSDAGGILRRLYLVNCYSSTEFDENPSPKEPGDMSWEWYYYTTGPAGTRDPVTNVCIITGEDDLTNSSNILINAGSTHFFVCHVETTLDDEYDRSGLGRESGNVDEDSSSTRLLDFSDCSSLRDSKGREIYMYRVL